MHSHHPSGSLKVFTFAVIIDQQFQPLKIVPRNWVVMSAKDKSVKIRDFTIPLVISWFVIETSFSGFMRNLLSFYFQSYHRFSLFWCDLSTKFLVVYQKHGWLGSLIDTGKFILFLSVRTAIKKKQSLINNMQNLMIKNYLILFSFFPRTDTKNHQFQLLLLCTSQVASVLNHFLYFQSGTHIGLQI